MTPGAPAVESYRTGSQVLPSRDAQELLILEHSLHPSREWCLMVP
jgi:hypothetical protein